MRILLAFLAAVTLLSPASAQTAYDQGYTAGYNDRWPASGVPNVMTDWGRGFNTGQDDSYEDEERHQEILRELGAPLDTD